MRTLTLLLLALATSASAAETSSYPLSAIQNGEARYASSTNRYSVAVPAGWKNVPGENMGLKENVLFHPKPVQGFACNIVFIEEPMPRKMKLSEATDASIAFMEKNIHEFRVTERREIKGSNGVMMERVRYRGRFLQQGVTSKNIVYVIPLGEDRLLSITVSGIEATPDTQADEADAAITKIKLIK